MIQYDKLINDSIARLHDGRALGMAIAGPPDGFPIFHFHGRGVSRLEVLQVAASASTFGIRLIGLDRPGIGCSDPRAGHRILDWPNDVVEVADQLGVEQFAIEGVSAGSAYAMACAYKIPDRLIACGLISSVNPGYLVRKSAPVGRRIVSWTAEHIPWLLGSLVRRALPASPDEAAMEKILVRVEASVGEPDRKLLRIPEFRKALAQGLAEGLHQGANGNVADTIAQVQPWGFRVEEITFKKMFLWHGEQDRIVPVTAARLLSQALPHCSATFYPGEGHFSTLVNRAQDIWKALSVGN